MIRQLLQAAVLLHGAMALANDWPAHLYDSARSGVTAARIALPLAEHWVHRSPAEPRPAWPSPQPGWTELPKVQFDDAFYTVADRDTVYFGSSVDQQVHALDGATGETRWTFYTAGPVRLAPTLAHDRVFAGSDDGRVYCLDRRSGALVWAYDAAPDVRRVLANGRIASLWPVRTGIVVEGDRVFAGSGIFPYHKVRMVSLDAANGEPLWTNDALAAYGGFSPQGYMLSARGKLIVPSGRARPVVIDCNTGELLWEAPASGGKGESGGVYGIIAEDRLFVGTQNTLFGCNLETGQPSEKFTTATRLLASDESYFLLKGPPAPRYGRLSISGSGNEISCLDRAACAKLGRKDAQSLKSVRRWRYARPDLASMILAGEHLIAGGENEVVVLDAATGQERWIGKVEGTAVGLAVAHGRLIVSTTKGYIHCFSAAKVPEAHVAAATPAAKAASVSSTTAKLAEGIVRETAVRRGYCLLLGQDSVDVACELAHRTELSITCLEPDAKRVEAARQQIDAQGLYGWRVTCEIGTGENLPFPDYAANLVVCLDGPDSMPQATAELHRVLRPCGGVLLARAELAKEWETAGSVTHRVPVLPGNAWTKVVRGELAGSGWWTHQYADLGNSGSSADQLVKGRLDVLWFGEPGADEFPDRHQRGSAPLVMNGRVFSQGWDFATRTTTVFCFDLYNGLRYWKRAIPGAVRLGLPAVAGNLACDAQNVYIVSGSQCHRLDATSGETRDIYETPPDSDGAHREWAYLAVAEGRLIGSTACSQPLRFSDRVFAFDITSGKRLWIHVGQEILDTTLALDGRRLLYVDKRATPEPSTSEPLATAKVDRKGDPIVAEDPVRTVAALDLATGKPAWEKEIDLTQCGNWSNGAFGTMQAICHDNVLVLAGAYTIYGRPPAVPTPRRAVAFSTTDGALLWSSDLANKSRPVMMQGALLAEPSFFDLKTGQKITRPGQKGREIPWTIGPRTGGCGSLSASECMVFGRGGYTMWRNVDGGPGGAFIGMRPGCLINIVPAGGVVLQAEASSGCSCYQAVQSTIVLRPRAAE